MAVRDVVQAAAGVGGDKLYVEDVFSTYLYTGTGSALTINNGIDLAGEGGLVWLKQRQLADNHYLFDTVRGTNYLCSDLTQAQLGGAGYLSGFTSSGFTVEANASPSTYKVASWTFRKAPKFFDVVTYTGTGSAQNIPHNLGSVPGCVIVKATTSGKDWYVYHRGTDATSPEDYYTFLNKTQARTLNTNIWDTAPTDTHLVLGSHAGVNSATDTYVAYLFAHDAGGFGDDGEQNVISCGSTVLDSNGDATVNLGWEPQWLLIKSATSTGSWIIVDNMRGVTTGGDDQMLFPNTSGAEVGSDYYTFNANGFSVNYSSASAGGTHIYIAIRRGPMKTPESGTEVFGVNFGSDTSTYTTNFPLDMSWDNQTTGVFKNTVVATRLIGSNALSTSETSAEFSGYVPSSFFQSNTDYRWNTFGSDCATYAFRRAPGFFDVVAYTGDSTFARAIPHNLGVAPELMIEKIRSGDVDVWNVYHKDVGPTKRLTFSTSTPATRETWGNTTPTDTNFYVGGSGVLGDINYTGYTYIWYGFASCPGVSKVGSYVGNGTGQNIDCGFSAGARFVMIKKTNSTGNWTVFDTARGIVAGNDPRLSLDNASSQITSFDYIDPYSGGFALNDNSTMNGSGDTYIFLAIA